MRKSDPELPVLPPLDFDPPSNGEFCPLPPTRLARRRWEMWREIVEEKHRRLGMSRRAFAESACGTAVWLYTLGQLAGCGSGGQAASGMGSTAGVGGSGTGAGGAGGGAGGRHGGGDAGADATASDQAPSPRDVSGYDVPPEAMEDMALAREMLRHDPFVFDVQTHVSFEEITPWPEKSPPQRVLDFFKEIFVRSNTTVACVSGVPATRQLGIANVRARVILREMIDRLGGPRLIFHCNADPERAGEPDYMAQAASVYRDIGAWKTYPQRPNHGLDHRDCEPFLERARQLGIKVIAAHRGISGNGDYTSPGSPADVVRAAKKFPDIKFLVYHSGWESGTNENHPYADQGNNTRGIDRFIKALKENGIGPAGNVYAELGSTWRNLMGNSMAAGHALGKLLAQIGPDRIVWGTDSVFTGNAQPQIDALWMFNIPSAIRSMYPSLDTEAKRKILGLNGAAVYGVDPGAVRYAIKNDEVDRLKMAYRDDPRSVPMPHPRQYTGPRTRREFLAFLQRDPHHAS
jgi:uncharacterized protein